MKQFVAYTDGYFEMDSQLGASACVILDNGKQNILYEKAKARRTTLDPQKKQRNNEQELGACIIAVMNVPDGCRLSIYSDSQYSVNVLSGKWNASSNLGLIDRFKDEVRKRHIRVDLFWVRGHNGGHWNEYADQLCEKAVAAFISEGKKCIESGKSTELQ